MSAEVFGTTPPEEIRHKARVIRDIKDVRHCGERNIHAILCSCTCGLLFVDESEDWLDSKGDTAICPRCDPERATLHNRWARPGWESR